MNIVFSSYPLTQGSLSLLRSLEDTQTLTLNELRLLSLKRLFRRMRALRASTLTVVIQDISERSLLGLMLALASFSRAHQLQVHDLPSGTIRQVTRMRALLNIIDTAIATGAGLLCILRLRRLARTLLRKPPLQFGPFKARKALYLKSNLMLGVKAGGSVGHIAGVANELFKLDPSMCFLASEQPPMVHPSTRLIPIRPLETYGFPAEANHFRFNDRCLRAASPLLSSEDFAFIYQRLSLGNLAGVVLSRKYSLPLVLEYNGSEVWVADNWGHRLRYRALAAMIEDVCLRHAHRVVTVSKVLADELVERGVPRERIVWYPNCVDPSVFDPRQLHEERNLIRAQLGVHSDELAVLFLGTFGVWHGAETFADAVREYFLAGHANESGKSRLRFIFVGDGLRLPAVRALLNAEAERGDVVFTGLIPQADAPSYLAAADIFVAPHVPPTDGSKFFGSPTKLFEYMAMERPIIASDLDQIGEVLSPGLLEHDLARGVQPRGDETAILTEPGSVGSLLRSLLALRSNPQLRQSLATAARRRALATYTWERHVSAIMRTLE
jgi:glycosyltransferase involved in cell wall biosynthesis